MPPLAANKIQCVFCRGMYLAENTSQAPSVRVVRCGAQGVPWQKTLLRLQVCELCAAAHKECAQETAKHLSKSLNEDF